MIVLQWFVLLGLTASPILALFCFLGGAMTDSPGGVPDLPENVEEAEARRAAESRIWMSVALIFAIHVVASLGSVYVCKAAELLG